MKKIQIYYFSGTGNTKWIAKKLQKNLLSYGLDVSENSIEKLTLENIQAQLSTADYCIIGFPVYGSTVPRIMQDFINNFPSTKNNIPIAVYATHALASGDSSYYIGKFLEPKGYKLLQTRHFKMMNNFHIPDFKFYKPSNGEKSINMLKKNISPIKILASEIYNEKPHIIGNNIIGKFLGNFQRKHIENLIDKLGKIINVNNDKCTNCGLCTKICPVKNISEINNQISFKENCIACMRCYSLCPENAIIFGEASNDIKKYPRYKGPKKY